MRDNKKRQQAFLRGIIRGVAAPITVFVGDNQVRTAVQPRSSLNVTWSQVGYRLWNGVRHERTNQHAENIK